MKEGSREREALREAVRSDYWRAETAAVVLAAWEASGESLTTFARRHGLRLKRLSRWQARLRHGRASAGPAFHPVVVRDSARDAGERNGIVSSPQTTDLELLLPGGHRIAVRRGFDAEVLRELLRALEGDRC